MGQVDQRHRRTRSGPHQRINRRGEGEHRGIADQQQEEPGIDCPAKARGQPHDDADHTRPGEQRRSRWLYGDDWERQHSRAPWRRRRGSTGGWRSPSCRSPQSASAVASTTTAPSETQPASESPPHRAPPAAAAVRRSIDQMRRATCSDRLRAAGMCGSGSHSTTRTSNPRPRDRKPA